MTSQTPLLFAPASYTVGLYELSAYSRRWPITIGGSLHRWRESLGRNDTTVLAQQHRLQA